MGRERVMIPPSAARLRDQILTEAHARGIDLEQEGLALEQDLPVLRLRLGGAILRSARIRLPGAPGRVAYSPDVITVHGSGFRASKAWPRKLDGTFNIRAVVNHLLALVNEELSRPRPALRVPVGVPAAASGLHVVHAAAVHLRTVPTDATPDDLVARIKDDLRRQKIMSRADRGGLTDGDLRVLSMAGGMFLGRAMKFGDFDPFEPSDHILTMLKIGARTGERIERRFVLMLDRRADEITVADPGGDGEVTMQERELDAAWKLGATTRVPWLGTLGRCDVT
jgi:hypothetical protein